MQKIMQDDRGLHFVCASMDRFRFVSNVLRSMVVSLAESRSQRLLKHVVRCYMRLADHPACVSLIDISNSFSSRVWDRPTLRSCVFVSHRELAVLGKS